MGSSSGEVSTKAIDPAVGGLVWVRRRNGSWWPGRIMGVDELTEGCLVSPRSGTPVKLLGREDASVDWYNLERSKRVKAFRCGEYDDCIEKAKAAAASSSKKAVKYARREDAILHALELESARQPKDHSDLCLIKEDKSDGEQHTIDESPTVSRSSEETELMDDDLSGFEDNSNSAQEHSQSGVSFEEPNQVGALNEQSIQERRRRTPNDSEDDGTEGIKRMRGLDDLGMGVVSSLKRKRSQVAKVYEFLKRKNRRRPLTKVLESTVMVSVPITCEQLASPTRSPLPGVLECKVSGLESNESKRSSMVINNNSDSTGATYENRTSLNASEHAFDTTLCKRKESEISSMLGLPENDSSDRLFDVPFVGDENHTGGASPIAPPWSLQKSHVGAGAQSSPSSQVEMACLRNEEFNESGSTSSGAADINNINQGIEKGTSKWQSKGKRNSRNTSKIRNQDLRNLVNADDKSNGIDTSPTSDSCTNRDISRPALEIETHVDEFQGWSRRSSRKEPHTSDCLPTPIRSLPYRQSRFTVNPKYQMTDFVGKDCDTVPTLYDVNLEVKSSYRPQHVPYISLMSKLNGQPIIGHPITIEVLEDGFCDLLVASSGCMLNNDPEENGEGYEAKDREGGKIPTKHMKPKAHVSPSKSPRARKNGLLSKKIRKLSSLTGSHKLGGGEKEKKPVVQKLNGPALACVPLKVVFSRINATLNSSNRPAH